MKSTIYKTIYRLMGAGFIAGGLATFVLMFGFFPEMAAAFYSDKIHILQEFGSAAIFIGMVALWQSANLDKGKAIHLSFTILFLLLALLHLIDFFKGNVPLASPLINTIPVIVFAIMYWQYDFDSDRS